VRTKIVGFVLALAFTTTVASTALATSRDDRTAQSTSPSLQPMSGDAPEPTTTSSTMASPEAVATTPPPETHASVREPARAVAPPADHRPPPGHTTPIGPIGELDDDGPVPAAFDIVGPTHKGGSNGNSASDSLAAAPSCSHQCITKGVAYLHGAGVELVIETSVPAQLYISVVADLDHDGNYESNWIEATAFGYSSYSWVLEGLTEGETYYVMVAATDDNFDTSYAWGEFTLP
jgi:hypothetical protein